MGIKENFVTVVKLKFFRLRLAFKSGALKTFVKDFSSMVDAVNRLVLRTRGRLMSFDVDSVVLS